MKMKYNFSDVPSGRFTRYSYYFTIIVYFLSALATVALFISREVPVGFWLALLLVQFTPHAEHYLQSRWNQFNLISRYFCVVPSFIYAFFWAATGYPVLYGATVFIMIFTSFISTQGLHIIWIILLAAIPGVLTGGYGSQFGFLPEQNIIMLFLLFGIIFLFLTVYGMAMNSNFIYMRALRHRLAEEKEFIERVNKVIIEASSSFSVPKIMKTILGAINDTRHSEYNYVHLLFATAVTKTAEEQEEEEELYSIDSSSETQQYFKNVKEFLEENNDLLYHFLVNKRIYTHHKNVQGNTELSRLLNKQDLFETLLSIPLIQTNQIIGVAVLVSPKAEKNLDSEDIHYIEKFISPIASIINNTLLHKNKEEQKQLIENKRIHYENISKELSKYLSPQVYRHIFSSGSNIDVSNKRKYLTVLLSELVGYTGALKILKHDKSTNLLNDYLDQMSEIAREYGATIDKYIGDNMLVFFGDPESKGMEKDAVLCVRMALAMRDRVKILKSRWHDMGVSDLSLRIGINSGYCNVGNFGSHYHMEYTLIGTNINLTRRIQQIASPDEILISESTYLLVHGMFECKELGEFRGKGITEVFKIYQVINAIRGGNSLDN